MASFGKDLKREREKRGVSLDTIAQETKVSLRHLNALETERFELLPGGVFNRGILRNYLQAAGMEEEPWMGRFFQELTNAGMDKAGGDAWLQYAQSLTGMEAAPRGQEEVRYRWVGVALLFLLLCVGAWLLWHFAQHRWH